MIAVPTQQRAKWKMLNDRKLREDFSVVHFNHSLLFMISKLPFTTHGVVENPGMKNIAYFVYFSPPSCNSRYII